MQRIDDGCILYFVHTLASCQAQHFGVLTHTLPPSGRKLEKLLSFQDIFSKIDLSHGLAEIKFEFFLRVSVSWFICSLKHGKAGYFGKESWKNFSVFKISTKIGINLPLTYLTEW